MSKFALLFLMIFFGGIIATLTYSGSSAFILYQLLYFLNPDSRWWSASIPGLSYSFISATLMLLALGVSYSRYSAMSPWKAQPIFKWMVLLLLSYYLVYAFALDLAIHQRFTYDFTKSIVIVLVAYKLVHSERLLHASIWAYLVGATYIGYLATITGRNSGDRVEGIGLVDAPDANGVAAALVPAAALLMYYAWLGNKKVKLLCVFCGALIANGLVLINSRGAFLGGVVGGGAFLFIMMFSKYRQKGQRGMAILIAVVSLGGALYVADDAFWERMQTLENPEDQAASGSHRVKFWLATLDVVEDHPMGVGVQGFNRLAEFYLGEEYKNKSVHSLWFQGLSEVGWLGLAFFLIMLSSLYRLSKKTRQWVLQENATQTYFKIRALECALVSYLVAGSFINSFRAEILFWMILLLAVAINIHYLRARGSEKTIRMTKYGERSAAAQ